MTDGVTEAREGGVQAVPKVFNKVILFLFMKRLIHFKKKGQTDTNIHNYVRIIRNFVMKVRQRKNENYNSDFRFCRHGIPYISFGLDKIIDCEDIYRFIANLSPDPKDLRINTESLKYEKDKADYILKNRNREEYIHRLEDMDEFRTLIHNVMPFIKNHHVDKLADDIKDLFDNRLFDKLVRAMLSVNDYGIRLGSSSYGDRFFYGNRNKDWYNILSTSDRKKYPQIISSFLSQYYETGSSDVETRLDIMINNNLAKLDKYDWRYYFVKYPRIIAYYPYFLDSDNLILLLEIAPKRPLAVPHRLNGKQLIGYHACALYIEVSMRLCGNNDYVCRGKDSDSLGSLLFESETQVMLSAEEDVIVEYKEEGDITYKISTMAVERYNMQKYEYLDYVERLEMMCRNVLYAEDLLLS